MARIRKSFPCSGPLYHREHRSKKGRRKYGSRWHRSITADYRLKLEKIIIKEFENEIRDFGNNTGLCHGDQLGRRKRQREEKRIQDQFDFGFFDN